MSDLDQDIVAVGLDLSPETLIKAYSNGVFPWPTPGLPLLWYCPRKRAVLFLENIYVSKRLNQYLKKSNFTFTVNRSFRDVIEACSKRDETWITEEMKAAYIKLHELGFAHSIEVWQSTQLVGGLYGVETPGAFAGESMFHTQDHASKAAVIFTSQLLQKIGLEMLDIQVLTPHMEALGAEEISRIKFLKLLASAQNHATRAKEKLSLKQFENQEFKITVNEPRTQKNRVQ